MAAGAAAVKTGPLAGLKVIEMAGLGPVPLAGLMLSEMGAEVLRIERSGSDQPLLPLSDEYNLDRHGRSILRVDLKQSQGIELVLDLVDGPICWSRAFVPASWSGSVSARMLHWRATRR
jgi:alpha-methylacyl-CoA racemase